ncbi:MAG: hypothetical protein NC452_10335 [Eubacterium sp.]|nr:hypothetical protein [Eubacterium sp.]
MKTSDIEEKLNSSEHFDFNLINRNQQPPLHTVINARIDEMKMSKADFIRKLNIDRNYGYMILNGTRVPTRSCLIKLSLLLGLDLEHMNYMLKLAGKAPLYVRSVTDAKVFYVLTHGIGYDEAVEFIWGSTSIK